MNSADVKYWVAFNLTPGIGRVRMSLLEKRFGDLETAWRAGAADLKSAGLDARSVSNILEERSRISPDEEMEKLARHQVKALTWHDPAFPSRLKEIYDVPPVLYVRGNLAAEDEWCVAVVGTRKPTAYGREVAAQISTDLARSKVTVVSGLARGTDSVAHRAALDAGGRTIAVLASGLDVVYPPENLKLAMEIAEHGALISDYPIGTQPRADYFPRRNRIMSGLSLGVLVVEAGDTSGALITANLALEQNRDVFAVPGSIFSHASKGTNRLVQEGAKLVTDAKDILEELNLTMAAQQLEMKELLPADDVEALLLKQLSAEPTHIDEVRRRSALPISTVSSTLTMMELKGLVKQVGGMNYIRAREARVGYAAGAN